MRAQVHAEIEEIYTDRCNRLSQVSNADEPLSYVLSPTACMSASRAELDCSKCHVEGREWMKEQTLIFAHLSPSNVLTDLKYVVAEHEHTARTFALIGICMSLVCAL